MLKRLIKEVFIVVVIFPAIMLLLIATVAKSKLFINQTPEKVDFIVVISGGDTLGRTQKAIDLYKDGYAPTIILSGAAADPDSPSNASVMRDYAISKKVNSNSLILEEDAEDTHQNAEKVTAILKKFKAKSIILVTSSYHTSRATKEFKLAASKANLDLKIISVQSSDKFFTNHWWVNPYNWLRVILELIKVQTIH